MAAPGNKTWHALTTWGQGSATFERLAGHVLRLDGFSSVDPSQPLGGADGLKDLLIERDGITWVVAAASWMESQDNSVIKAKFLSDFEGVKQNGAQGFVFITNQRLSVGFREKLKAEVDCDDIEIYHCERIAGILDSPAAYGIRLEYLDIQMTKEEQISFFQILSESQLSSMRVALEEQRLAVEQVDQIRAAGFLRNHAITLFQAFADYNAVATRLVSPISQRHPDDLERIPSDFDLRDLRDFRKPLFMMKYSLHEPGIVRYAKVRQRLLDELIAVIRGVDISSWPELAENLQSSLEALWSFDSVEHILSSSTMMIGQTPAYDLYEQKLSEATNDLTINGAGLLDPFKALAMEIKALSQLLPSILEQVDEICSESSPGWTGLGHMEAWAGYSTG